jgi:hypothetical protein
MLPGMNGGHDTTGCLSAIREKGKLRDSRQQTD